MKIRVSGPAAEVLPAVELIARVFPDAHPSRTYPSRAGGVRVYVDATLPDWRESVDLMCPWCRLVNVIDNQGRVPDGMAWYCRCCRRLYALFHGLIVEAITVPAADVQPDDLLRVPDGWGPAGDRRRQGPQFVFRPSLARPSADVPEGVEQ